MKKKNKLAVEMGKKGASIRWADRYYIISELGKFYGSDKQMMNTIMTWPTAYLKKLLNWHMHIKK